MLKDERHFRPKLRRMICTMLRCIRPVFVDIWHVILGVCFWLSWISKATSSSTVVSTCMLQSATLMLLFGASCCPYLFSNVSQSLPGSVYLQKFCQYSLRTAFLNSQKFLVKALSPLLNARYITGVLSLKNDFLQ